MMVSFLLSQYLICAFPAFCFAPSLLFGSFFPEIKKAAAQKGESRIACYGFTLLFYWLGDVVGCALGMVLIKAGNFSLDGTGAIILILMRVSGAVLGGCVSKRRLANLPPANGHEPQIEQNLLCKNCGEPIGGETTECPMCGSAASNHDC